jgi:hypothetical protein
MRDFTFLIEEKVPIVWPTSLFFTAEISFVAISEATFLEMRLSLYFCKIGSMEASVSSFWLTRVLNIVSIELEEAETEKISSILYLVNGNTNYLSQYQVLRRQGL